MTDIRSTRRWKELSKRIIQRDGVCCVCGTDVDLTVDHIIPIAMGGDPWAEENLVTMCAYHNKQKGARIEGQTTDYLNPRWIQWEKTKEKNNV